MAASRLQLVSTLLNIRSALSLGIREHFVDTHVFLYAIVCAYGVHIAIVIAIYSFSSIKSVSLHILLSNFNNEI